MTSDNIISTTLNILKLDRCFVILSTIVQIVVLTGQIVVAQRGWLGLRKLTKSWHIACLYEDVRVDHTDEIPEYRCQLCLKDA
jgi:hypothetical protein